MNISRQHAKIAYSRDTGDGHCHPTAFCQDQPCTCFEEDLTLCRTVGAACSGKEWGHTPWHAAHSRKPASSLEVPGRYQYCRQAVLLPAPKGPSVVGTLLLAATPDTSPPSSYAAKVGSRGLPDVQ